MILRMDFAEAAFCELRVDGVLRSSPQEMATWHTNLAHMGDAPGARLLSKAIGRVLFTGVRGRGFPRSSWARRSKKFAGSKHFPTEVGVEAVIEHVRVVRERLVGERALHAAHDGVRALGLGAGVLLIHQFGV